MNELRKEDNEAFRNWVTPYNLARLQARDFFRMRNVGKSKLAQLAEDLRTIGIRTFLNPRRQQPL